METDSTKSYLVLGNRTWNQPIFCKEIEPIPGQWTFIGDSDELSIESIRDIDPVYLFFLHWSHVVPDEIIEEYECVCFHMTDVPYGRGGSPLQNLIIRGRRSTKLTALRMTSELDAGPVYLKEDLSLEGSTAEEIYLRATHLSAQMIRRIVKEELQPTQQEGEVTIFKRRQPSQSRLPKKASLQEMHDFIRMLDAEGYPQAFLERNGFRFTFRRAARYDGRIEADVTITPIERDDPE